jgi:hypothetical protein
VGGGTTGVLFANPAPEPDPYEWHHFKFVKDGSFCSLYIDGSLVVYYKINVSVTGGNLVLAGAPGTHQFDNVVINALPEPDVIGCIELYGDPLSEIEVTLKQQGSPPVSTVTDSYGCYKFRDLVSSEKIKLEFDNSN